MCQTESELKSERGQLRSAPLRIQFGVTPSQETVGPDLIPTVKSLAVRIWTGRLLQFSNKLRNKDIPNRVNKKY